MPYLGFSAKNDITINATSDLELTSDNTTIKFGADDDVTITHDPDDGLIFKSIATADDNPFLLTIQTGETDLAANDVIGKIQFQAPDEGTGTDANLVSAAIQAVAEGDFSSSSNATSLQFMTGSSEAATTKMTILSSGKVGIGGTPTAGSFHIFGTSTTDQVIIENTNTGGSSAPDLVLFRKSTSSAADGDVLGRIDFRGLNDANEEINYATIFSTLADASDGTENGKLTIQQRIGSSYVESFTLNEDGNVGIGTTSPQQLLHVSANNPGGKIRLEMGQSGVANGDVTGEIQFYHNDSSGAGVNADIKGICTSAIGAGALTFGTGTTSTTERLRIDSSGNVGIGESSPDTLLHISDSVSPTIRITNTDTTVSATQTLSEIQFEGSDSSTNADGIRAKITALYGGVGGFTSLQFFTAGENTETLSRILDLHSNRATINEDGANIDFRVESSGSENMLFVDAGNDRVGIGTNSPTYALDVESNNSGGLVAEFVNTATSIPQGVLINFPNNTPNVTNRFFLKMEDSTSVKAEINTTGGGYFMGDVGIGTDSPNANLNVQRTNDETYSTTSFPNATANFKKANNSGTANQYSSIRLQVTNDNASTNAQGVITAIKTSASTHATTLAFQTRQSGGSVGEAFRVDDSQRVIVGKTSNSSSTAGTTLYSNGKIEGVRDGDVVHSFNRLSSDGTIVSFQKDGTTVGSIGTTQGDVTIGTGDTMLRFQDGDDSIVPRGTDSAVRDNAIDLGNSNQRFDDVFATNGTIQTSDENEKQDIASATDKELNVAKKLSTLFKTFRWRDKVVEKGDKARTHTGIVAQEVKSAFEAEGLDATKYGLFISDTWTNDDGKEQTRLGVRYPELFSFIFSSIEARLTALEGK